MSIEQNKAFVRDLYATVFNGKNLAAIDDYFAADVTDHSLPPGAPSGIAGVRQTISMFTTTFPDLQITVEDLVAEGDQVAARWTMRATHEGEGMGMPPTGKRVTLPGISILRLASGRACETWAIFDQMSLLRQLGLVPAPAAA